MKTSRNGAVWGVRLALPAALPGLDRPGGMVPGLRGRRRPARRRAGGDRHRRKARGERPEDAAQHPGARHPEARPVAGPELQRTTPSSCPASPIRPRAPATPTSISAAWPAARTATTPARCPASASIWTSSRSPPSAARRTSTTTTSRGSRPWPGAGHALWRQLPVRHPADHHQPAADRRLLGRLQPGGQRRRPRRRRLHRRGLRQPAGQRQDGDPPGRLVRARRRLYRQRHGHRRRGGDRRRRPHLSDRQRPRRHADHPQRRALCEGRLQRRQHPMAAARP